MNRKELIDDLVKNEIVNAISNGSKVEDLIDELGFSVDKMKSKKGDDKLKLIKNTELLISFLKDCINPNEEEVQKILTKSSFSFGAGSGFHGMMQPMGGFDSYMNPNAEGMFDKDDLFWNIVDILEGRLKILNTAPPTDNIVDRLLKQIN